MNKITYLILILSFTCLLTGLKAECMPKYFTGDSNKNKVLADPLYNNTVIIPAKYVLSVKAIERLSASNLSVPDKIKVILNSDFYFKNKLIASEGSIIQGTVVKSETKVCKQQAKLQIKFTAIVTPDGQNIPISAIIKTEDKKGVLYGDEGIGQNESFDIIIMQPVTYIQIK